MHSNMTILRGIIFKRLFGHLGHMGVVRKSFISLGVFCLLVLVFSQFVSATVLQSYGLDANQKIVELLDETPLEEEKRYFAQKGDELLLLGEEGDEEALQYLIVDLQEYWQETLPSLELELVKRQQEKLELLFLAVEEQKQELSRQVTSTISRTQSVGKLSELTESYVVSVENAQASFSEIEIPASVSERSEKRELSLAMKQQEETFVLLDEVQEDLQKLFLEMRELER